MELDCLQFADKSHSRSADVPVDLAGCNLLERRLWSIPNGDRAGGRSCARHSEVRCLTDGNSSLTVSPPSDA